MTRSRRRRNESNGIAGMLTSLVIGAAAGAVMGLLYAPEKGDKTRKKLNKKIKVLKKDLEKQADHLLDNVDDYKEVAAVKYEELKGQLDDVKDRLKKA